MNKKKLLVVNLQSPCDSCYRPSNSWTISWLLGRRLNNYLFFVIGKDGSATKIDIPANSDFKNIEEIFKKAIDNPA
jgi:hypothetical protein